MTCFIATIANANNDPNGGRLADAVLAAFNELLQEPLREHSPHTFEIVERPGIDGELRPMKIFPRAWLARLERAIEVRAFERMTPSEVAKRILETEGPQA